MKEKNSTAAHVCSACTSLVCMAQMGAMATAGGAAMGAMSAASTGSIPLLTRVFQIIGLGFLLGLPSLLYQVLLIAGVVVTIFLAGVSYKGHRNPGPLVFTIVSSALLYGSIYMIPSEPIYWIAFGLMLVSAIWTHKLGTKMRNPVKPIVELKR